MHFATSKPPYVKSKLYGIVDVNEQPAIRVGPTAFIITS